MTYITLDEAFGVSPDFTEKVMSVFSRHYNNIHAADKALLVSQLTQKPCIVTRSGMRKPIESYFKNVSLFKDLPVVHFSNPRSVSDTFLKALGVREHVDLQTVFDRLLDLNWDHIQLIKYLASVQDKLSDVEWGRLKATKMFPKDGSSENERCRACELYAPTEKIKSFGLPVIAWNSRWRSSSDEGNNYLDFWKRLI
jgi:hypothetical protein